MIRALIFDFDGLILDTETPMFETWREIYDSHGCHIDFEKWVGNIGKGVDDFDPLTNLERLLGRQLDRERLDSTRRKRERALVDVQPALPGVEDYLRDARRLGLKVGMATCSSKDWVVSHLRRLGLLKYFDCIQTAEDVHSLKPDPELYQKALECLRVNPIQALAFEDSAHGIQAAKRAGLHCVFVPNPLIRHLPGNHADVRLVSLGDKPLEDLLRIIEA